MFRTLVCLSVLCVLSVHSARILGVFPTPSISHQVVFRALTFELARRGHELVVITTDPALPKNRPPDNITEIDVSYAYDNLRKMMTEGKNLLKRGVIVSPDIINEAYAEKSMVPTVVSIIESPEVKKILLDKNQHFDLIFIEAYMTYQLIVTKFFNAPVIEISSLHGFEEFHETMGAPGRNPMVYANVLSDSFEPVTIMEKLKLLKFEYDYMQTTRKNEAYENELLKQNYGPDAPTIEELKENIDLYFLNSNPVFCGGRPLPPNMIYVGPLHMNPLKPLPEELKTYLDNSKRGVIYVSLGTNVRPSQMDKDLLDSFLDAFRELPYNILWKFDGDNLDNLPQNVRMQKWFPQRDLLVHPNVKLFVMQGGLQSTDEAIDAGVPLVGIPMLGDQYFNVHRYVKLGIGVKVDALTLTKDSLLEGINKVLNDDSYRSNMSKLKQLMSDQPEPPLARAAWWAEYLLRRGGARHLRSPAAGVSWPRFLMLDVLAAVSAVLLLVLVLLVLAVRFLIGLLFGNGKVKKE